MDSKSNGLMDSMVMVMVIHEIRESTVREKKKNNSFTTLLHHHKTPSPPHPDFVIKL